MESHGVSGGIQVTLDTYRYIHEYYHFQERGLIPVKDKGEVFTYLLLERKATGLQPPKLSLPVPAAFLSLVQSL